MFKARITPLESLRRDKAVMQELEATLHKPKKKLPREDRLIGGKSELLSTFKAIQPDSAESLSIVTALPEAIILATGRPTLLVEGGTYEAPALAIWQQRLDPSRTKLEGAIASVGRIELFNHPDYQWVGTGWIVSPQMLITNSHVARVFARNSGSGYVFAPGIDGNVVSSQVDFQEEYRSNAPFEVQIERILYIAPPNGPDMALLQIATDANLPNPIELESRDAREGDMIAAIGYPAYDTRNNGNVMSDLFKDIYDVKRLAPGFVTSIADPVSFAHDCTTLGGSSGSTIIKVDTGKAIGLHFSGRFGVANYAVKISAIKTMLAVSSSHVVSTPTRAAEARAKVKDFENRDGYQEKFLGVDAKFRVSLPLPSEEQLDDAVPVSDDASLRGINAFVLNYRHFSIVMKRSRRMAYFTAVNIDGSAEVKVGSARPKWLFDPRIPQEFQIGDDIYGGPNKVDRGHLVRRLDPVWGKPAEAREAHDDTHMFTNAAPQQHTYNDSDWGDLEDYLLYNTNNEDQKLTIFTGPVFRDSDVTWRGIQIPEEFWKVAVMVVSGKRLHATAYLVSQRPYLDDLEFVPGKFRNYQVSIQRIEELTGLSFGKLKDLDPLNSIESAVTMFELRGLEGIQF